MRASFSTVVVLAPLSCRYLIFHLLNSSRLILFLLRNNRFWLSCVLGLQLDISKTMIFQHIMSVINKGKQALFQAFPSDENRFPDELIHRLIFLFGWVSNFERIRSWKPRNMSLEWPELTCKFCCQSFVWIIFLTFSAKNFLSCSFLRISVADNLEAELNKEYF